LRENYFYVPIIASRSDLISLNMLRKTNTDSRKNHTILLKYLKIWLDIDLKIILLNYQNYYVKRSDMSNAAKNLDVLKFERLT